jgi:hypothetical protein
MQSDSLTTADWAMVTDYMDVPKQLKAATKRLEECRNSRHFGAIAEIIVVFEYILNYYEQCIKVYEAVDYNAHNKAPKNHLAINLRVEWAKANKYYAKLDLSLVYYAATVLHLYYKPYCNSAWSNRPDWLETNNRNFCALWTQYNTSLRVVRRPKVLSNNMDDAINSFINPSALANNSTGDNEFIGGGAMSCALRRALNTQITLLNTE